MKGIVFGWVLFPVVSAGTAIVCAEAKVRSDTTIMVTYGVLLLIPVSLICRATWRVSQERGWSPFLGVGVIALQWALLGAGAAAWLIVMALIFSPYK